MEKKELKEKQQNRNNRGITLIALVVTIVVLLILATVSISMLGGENGIITQAKISSEETRGGAVEEARNLWRTSKKVGKYTSNRDTQTLDELLNDLVEQDLLTSEEKEQIKKTGSVKIGSRTIDFDLPGKLEVYASARAVCQYINGKETYEPKIVYEIKIPLTMMEEFEDDINVEGINMGLSVKEFIEFNENVNNIINESSNDISKEEKEKLLYYSYLLVIRSLGGKDVTVEEYINMLAKEQGITEECYTFEEYYNAMKNSDFSGSSFDKNMSYDEFLDKSIEELMPTITKMLEALNESCICFYRDLSFEYTIIKPNGEIINENITINPALKNRLPCFEIDIPADEYGEYQFIIKNIETEFEGENVIEYTDSPYLVTYGGDTTYLYDMQMKEKTSIDRIYMYSENEKIDISDNDEYMFGNGIQLFKLNQKNIPYEIEFVKDDVKYKFPVLIIDSPR